MNNTAIRDIYMPTDDGGYIIIRRAVLDASKFGKIWRGTIRYGGKTIPVQFDEDQPKILQMWEVSPSQKKSTRPT